MDTPDLDSALGRYCRFFEELNPVSLGQIDDLFTRQALFSDPFNRVRGPAAIRRIFEHLLEHWPNTRFEILEACRHGEQAYLRWAFQPDPSRPLRIEGVSRVRFDAHGRVLSHQDYWDSASQLYARLPLLGGVVRWLLRRSQAVAADQTDAPQP